MRHNRSSSDKFYNLYTYNRNSSETPYPPSQKLHTINARSHLILTSVDTYVLENIKHKPKESARIAYTAAGTASWHRCADTLADMCTDMCIDVCLRSDHTHFGYNNIF